MENHTKKSGKEIIHEMLDTIVRRYHEVERGEIQFYYPPVGDMTVYYEDVNEYDTIYVRYGFMLDVPLDINEIVMVSNICKAKFSSCQYAGYCSFVCHEVLIPINSSQRNDIFKMELNRVIAAVMNVRQFLDSNALHHVDQGYRELMSDILDV